MRSVICSDWRPERCEGVWGRWRINKLLIEWFKAFRLCKVVFMALKIAPDKWCWPSIECAQLRATVPTVHDTCAGPVGSARKNGKQALEAFDVYTIRLCGVRNKWHAFDKNTGSERQHVRDREHEREREMERKRKSNRLELATIALHTNTGTSKAVHCAG